MDLNTIPTKQKHRIKSLKNNAIIDVTKALKLRLEKGLSYDEIGKIFGVTGQAVYQRLNSFKKYIDNPEIIQAFNENKVNILTVVEQELVSNLLAPDKVKKASLNNIAYALQNVSNINRLEQGKSTSNVNIHSLVDHVSKEIDRATEELRQLEQSIAPQDIVSSPDL